MYTKTSKRKQGSRVKIFTKDALKRHREELLFVSTQTHRLNSFSSTISEQNKHFNMYNCICKYLNSNKVPREKILIQNVLKRQILPDSIANI